MPINGFDALVAGEIRPSDLRDYLTARGWRLSGEKAGVFAAYLAPQGSEIEVLLPLDASLLDFKSRVHDLVEAVAAQQNRPAQDLANELVNPTADVLRFKRNDPFTTNGTIQISEGLRLLESAKDALMTSACMLLDPKPYFKRLSRKEADDFMASARLGQTERGSFIATVIVPLATTNSARPRGLFADHSAPSFSRQAVTLLMRSIGALKDAASRRDARSVTDVGDPQRLVSANLCDALLGMKHDSSTVLEVSAQWSWKLGVADSTPHRVQLSEAEFDFAGQVAEILKPREEDRQGRFVGKIVQLAGAEGDGNRMSGPVTLQFQHEDGLLKAKLELGVDDYRKACDAHKAASFVSVRGVLRHAQRVHSIDEPVDFTVLPDMFPAP